MSSNRIEGVAVEPSRIAPLVFGAPPLRDRNEEEICGYREALRLVHERQLELACPGLSRDTIRRVLRQLKAVGEVECLGRGPGAGWQKRGTPPEMGE